MKLNKGFMDKRGRTPRVDQLSTGKLCHGRYYAVTKIDCYGNAVQIDRPAMAAIPDV
jgi:hypothetical protein